MGKHKNVAVFVPHNGCPHTCTFCSQRSISGHQSQPSPDEVISATETALASASNGDSFEIAFFGGSFTAIDRSYMLLLLKTAFEYIRRGLVKGIRISTRPDCIDREVLDILRSYGVTSIELGAQSMSNHVLTLAERGHTAEDVVKASSLIKEYGFSLGLQMMTGLYGDTDDSCRKSAQKIAELSPDTVRIYPTIVIEGTQLAELYKQGCYVPQSLSDAVCLCAELLKFFSSRSIPVIKLGLEYERSLLDSYVAGPFHSAFRELCESKIYLDKMLELLPLCGGESAVFLVCPSHISKAVGQKRSNIIKLSEMGYRVRIVPCATVQPFDIQLPKDGESFCY